METTKLVREVFLSNELIKLFKKSIKTLSGYNGSVISIAITPDGRYVISGSDDYKVKIWDIETGEEIKTLLGHNDFVFSVAITSDGRYVVSGSVDGTIKIWDIETGKEIKTLSGHNVLSVAVTPDGKYIVSGSVDGTIKIWDIESGKEIKTLSGHNSHVFSVAVTQDGRYVVSGSDDKTIKIWDMIDVFEKVTPDDLVDCFSKIDTKRINLTPYDKKRFEDIQSGSWDVYEAAKDGEVKVELK